MRDKVQKCLIVGLGNPGGAYDETRHNIGFQTIRAFAQKMGVTFRHVADFIGEMAQCQCFAKKALLLLPLTYMNSSGEAVKRCMEYFGVSMSDLLVVCDDIALPFGRLKLKAQGSSGGHNGLKSIEQHLGRSDYARLRVGIGEKDGEALSEYVLGRFTSEERQALPRVVDGAVGAIELWLSSGIESAMRTTNTLKVDEIGE